MTTLVARTTAVILAFRMASLLISLYPFLISSFSDLIPAFPAR